MLLRKGFFFFLAKLDVWLLFQKDVMCSLYRIGKLLSVCPTYSLLQSRQVGLYTPDSENVSGQSFCAKVKFPLVLLVRRAILRSVFLKALVM